MSAPPSLTRRTAACTAASVPVCSGPNGKSQLTSARVTPAAHGLADDEHLVERHFERARMAPEVDAHRVADRDEIDAGPVGDLRHLVVPRHDADDLRPVALHLLERGDRDGGLIRGHAVLPHSVSSSCRRPAARERAIEPRGTDVPAGRNRFDPHALLGHFMRRRASGAPPLCPVRSRRRRPRRRPRGRRG